ncbi:hypothetical protein WJX72_006045 [[Myrmecia] bisecta]|uniref:Uncharacterized protein n=1 Tax=[Myrmecia] bisecta TaxID=41462 RepID=A0AAW1PL55_9CHLO
MVVIRSLTVNSSCHQVPATLLQLVPRVPNRQDLFSYVQFVGGENFASGKGDTWCAMNCYRNCADIEAQQAGGLPLGPVLQLAFDHCANVSAEDLDMMHRLQLPIARQDAFPQVAAVCYRGVMPMLRCPSVEELEWLVCVMRAVRLAIDCEVIVAVSLDPRQPAYLRPFCQTRTVVGPEDVDVNVQLQYPPTVDALSYSGSGDMSSGASTSSDVPFRFPTAGVQPPSSQLAQQAQQQQAPQDSRSAPPAASCRRAASAHFDADYLAVLDAMVDDMVDLGQTAQAGLQEGVQDNGEHICMCGEAMLQPEYSQVSLEAAHSPPGLEAAYSAC